MPTKTKKPPKTPPAPPSASFTPPGRPRHRVMPSPPQMPDFPEGQDAFGGMIDMGPSEEERIANWIESVFAKDKPNLNLRLCHMVGGGGQVPIRDWTYKELAGEEDPTSIADTIYACASEEADTMTSVARFAVIAASGPKSFSQISFRITPEALANGTGGETEEPGTAGGLLAQTYRHNEMLFRMHAAQAMQTQRQNSELHATMAKIQSDYVAQRIKGVELYENMKDRKIQRDIVYGKHLRKEKIASMTFGMATNAIMRFGPDLMRRVGLVSDEDKAIFQSQDAVVDWLAAMPDAEAKIWIEKSDPKQREIFEKAWVGAKKRAAGAAAAAALTGLAQPKALGESQSAPQQSGVQPSPPTSGADEPAIELTADEIKLLNRTTSVMLKLLAGLEGMMLDIVMSYIPTATRDEVRASRVEYIERQSTGKSRESPGKDWQLRLLKLQGAVISTLGRLDEAASLVLFSHIPEEHRDDVKKMQAIIQERMKPATAA